MAILIDRRSLLLTGTLGLGALAVPGFAQTLQVSALRGFTHSVASGEPGADTMLLWTRYVPDNGGDAKIAVEVAETPDFSRIAAGGEMVTGPWRDHTVKLTVTGLKAGTRYHYRFVAPDGSKSPVGRTRTLPADDARSFRMAIFSCSNLGFGWFNAYAHAAARDDLDLALHLGDYLYEYAPGTYPLAAETVAGRLPEPQGETIHLADYRLRYASYRADPDLQALHAAMPMIVSMDDHEAANDSWEGGAENHQPDSEGDWNARRAAAIQAWHEWLPVSDEPWKAYDIGALATFFRTDTRLSARSRAPDIAPLFREADPAAALKAFRDGPWQDPSATMMGSTQEAWLARGLEASVRSGKRWQVVGFGTIMGEMRMPSQSGEWLKPDASEEAKRFVAAGLFASKAGLPLNFDNWGGYPAARSRFLNAVQAADANLITLCGDSHNAWAFDLAQGTPVGVEFAGQAVTSPGYEASSNVDPKVMAAGLIAASSELKWCDVSRRGYMALTLTPERARNDWVFVDDVRQRSARGAIGHSATVERGRRRMSAA